MAIYVDSLKPAAWRWGRSCHLVGDTLAELHAFAASIGLARGWFQPKSRPHYDLSPRKRAQAVRAGAVELSSADFVAKIREIETPREGTQ